MPHLGVRIQGVMTLKFEIGQVLCSAPTPKFHHPTFTRSEVVVLTNKQTDDAENIQRSLLRYDVG